MTEQPPKKPYTPPKLTQFGAFSKLTAGGSGPMAEGTMMTNTMRRA